MPFPPGWGQRTLVMGVLNITPDSFSDGGLCLAPERAVAQASRLLAAGADVLDLGAQSTRPGAEEVGPQQEWARLSPVLALLRQHHPEALLSVDTFHAAVAERALTAGAHWINDVRGANPQRRDPAMLPLAAATAAPIVLMHSRGDSQGMDQLTAYGDLVEEVRQGLLAASEAAVAAGVDPSRILWDPGLGFAKDVQQNLRLLHGLSRLAAEGFPLLVGPSRKRFIGSVLQEPRPKARLWGTAAVCSQAILQGAQVLRVHDVRPIVQVARMTDAIVRAEL